MKILPVGFIFKSVEVRKAVEVKTTMEVRETAVYNRLVNRIRLWGYLALVLELEQMKYHNGSA